MHKLSRQIVVNKMAEDVELRALARERILETFQIESLKDLEREALEMLVGGRDVLLIHPVVLLIHPVGSRNERAAEIEPTIGFLLFPRRF